MEASEDIPIQYQEQRPYMPPRKDDSQTVMTILMIVAILVVVQLVFTVLIYIAVLDLGRPSWNPWDDVIQPPTQPTAPTGQFAYAQATSRTSATVEFAGFSVSPAPVNLMIILENETHSGTYTFPSNNDGTVLIRQQGYLQGTITYQDFGRNSQVDSGDQLYLTGLTPGCTYTVRMLWMDGSTLDVEDFDMPA